MFDDEYFSATDISKESRLLLQLYKTKDLVYCRNWNNLFPKFPNLKSCLEFVNEYQCERL